MGFSRKQRRKISHAICDCGDPATTILRGVAQCDRCASCEKKLYPIGWAGVAAKKSRPLIVSFENECPLMPPYLGGL